VDDTEKMKLKKKESMAKIRLVVDRVDSGWVEEYLVSEIESDQR
jgi:hypothetical protein